MTLFVPDGFLTRLTEGYYLAAIVPIFTSIFLHAGLPHLAGNMLFLYIFGDNMEDRLDPRRYQVFYLVGRDGRRRGSGGRGGQCKRAYDRCQHRNRRIVRRLPPAVPVSAGVGALCGAVLLVDHSLAGGVVSEGLDSGAGSQWQHGDRLDCCIGRDGVGAHESGFLAGAGLAWVLRGRRRASIDVRR